MTLAPEVIAADVMTLLAAIEPGDHGAYLRALMAHAAAGIVTLEGDSAATEVCYRLGDAIVTRRRG